MSTLERLREISFTIASCNKISSYTGGAVIATLGAIPLLLLSRGLLLLAPSYSFMMFIAFLTLSFAIIQLGLKAPSAEYQVYGMDDEMDSGINDAKKYIVLDQIVGMVLVFWGISFSLEKWKLIVLGVASFHILNHLKPSIMVHEYLKKLDELPGAAGMMATDIVFGLAVNIVVRLLNIV